MRENAHNNAQFFLIIYNKSVIPVRCGASGAWPAAVVCSVRRVTCLVVKKRLLYYHGTDVHASRGG